MDRSNVTNRPPPSFFGGDLDVLETLAMTIRLTTFGRLRAMGEDGELDSLLGRRLRAALFIYLAVERRVPRSSLSAVFWPERDEDRARHALRQSLYDLRKVLGVGWLEATAHEVRVKPDVHTDAHTFMVALERGDAESAARLYEGPFLEGIHLVDQKPWESWVDGRRTAYGRAFRRACRGWLEARRSAGDLAGALEAAQRWAAPDPFDDEAQHRLIETLAEAGERTEAIRQYETYTRLLEPERLRPLDETVALIERVRSEVAAWPEREGEPDAPAPATPSEAPAHASPASTPRSRWRRRAVRYRPWSVLAGISVLVGLLAAFWLVRPGAFAGALGSLWAEGAITEGERIVLADFGGPRTDPSLGVVVTDALQMDLLMTEIVQVLDPSEVREVLDQMQVEDGAPLNAERAREVALRIGAKAVLDGEIAQAGTGYVLTAALRAAESGQILAAFRETAGNPDEVIPAIDRLSREIRRRAGESLRSLDAAPPLASVTSSSLDALRIYSEADRAFEQGDYVRVISLLEDAVELDPEFAMAWRLLAVTLGNAGWDQARELEAATRAYELRDRLRPRERYLTAARYHSEVTHDHGSSVKAYRRVLELRPDDDVALNNLALMYHRSGDFETAAELFEKAISLPEPSAIEYHNLVLTRLAGQQLNEARKAMDVMSKRFPDHLSTIAARFWVLLHQGDTAGARAAVEPVLTDADFSPRERAWAHDLMARVALWRGRLVEARGHFEAAERIASDAGPPHNPFAWRLGRALAEAMVGGADSAVQLLRDGIEDGLPERVTPLERYHFLQAIVLGMAGRSDAAEAVLQRFQAEVPPALHDGYHTHNESARALIQLQRGDPNEAVRTLERVRALQPCRFCFARLMGWALRDAGRLEEAAKEWEVSVAGKDVFFYPGFHLAEQLWVLQRLPSVYEELDDTTRALHHYRRLVNLWQDADPELEPLVEHARERMAALEEGAAGRGH